MSRPQLSLTEETRELLAELSSVDEEQASPMSRSIEDVVRVLARWQANNVGAQIPWLGIYAMEPSDFGVIRTDALYSRPTSVSLSMIAESRFDNLYTEINSCFPNLTIRGAYSSVVCRLMVRAAWLILREEPFPRFTRE